MGVVFIGARFALTTGGGLLSVETSEDFTAFQDESLSKSSKTWGKRERAGCNLLSVNLCATPVIFIRYMFGIWIANSGRARAMYYWWERTQPFKPAAHAELWVFHYCLISPVLLSACAPSQLKASCMSARTDELDFYLKCQVLFVTLHEVLRFREICMEPW